MMRLESIRLSNFRQFYGVTPTLHFAHGERNVTIIHGANGAGKTALLNAFTWSLYGEFSRGFQVSDDLVNKRAIREASVGDIIKACVELSFESLGKRYFLKRTTEVEKIASEKGWRTRGKDAVLLQCLDTNGQTRTISEYSDTIGRMLPPDLYKYFFFDGERIERLVQPDPQEKKDIASATKKLLGIEVLLRGERRLRSAKKELERELRAIGDTETVGLLDEKRVNEERFDREVETIKTLSLSIDGFSAEKRALQARLRDMQEVKSLQMRRDALQGSLAAKREALTTLRAEIDQEIRKHGLLVFLDRVSKRFVVLADELRQRGELPAGIKRQFVEDLLERNECICGGSLHPSECSTARRQVERWMTRAGVADVEEHAIRLRGEVATFPAQLESFWSRVSACKESIGLQMKEISHIENEFEEIRERLKVSTREEVAELERRHERLDEAIQQANREIGVHTAAKESVMRAVAELEKKISKHKAIESRQKVAQRRVETAVDAVERVVEVRQLFEQELRFKLQQKVREIFRSISITPYVPQVEEDLSLTLHESAGGTSLLVAASTGESQVLSVAFIGSLIALTKEYKAMRDALPGPDDVEFPVVMDSPFGSLDQHHRQEIASHIPKLADQVVAMVSKSQWLGPVEDSLGNRTARQYVLTYFTPRTDVASESVTINGRNYEIVKQSPNDFEYTMIQEVTDGRA